MILGDLYYALGFLVFLVLIFIVTQFTKFYNAREWSIKYTKVIGKEPEKKDFRSEQEYTDYIAFQIFSIIEFLWMFMGLLTRSWSVFGVLFLFVILNSSIRVRLGFEPLRKLTTLSLLWLKIFIYGWLVINHFHLHQDFWAPLKELF